MRARLSEEKTSSIYCKIKIERNGLDKNNLLFILHVLSYLASQTYVKTKLAFRVIGIEEPEVHLHPYMDAHLVKNLSKVNNSGKEEDYKKDTQ